MVALSPLTAGSPAPGFVRPTVAVQAQPSQAPSNSATGNATVAPAATPVVSISIGGGAASSAIANQVRSELINSSRALAAGGDPSAASGRPAAAVPTPPYSQNVGLYDAAAESERRTRRYRGVTVGFAICSQDIDVTFRLTCSVIRR